MFLHDTHLPQILSPDDYTSQEQFEREKTALFQPAWHLVGTFADLPNDGDFLTTEILERPLIVWRSQGEFQTFLNVCPHRFSQLSCAAHGSSLPNLKCQYHGWEFDCDGQTRAIPDARSFKPLTKGALSLQKIRTETLGQLIFVNLDEDAPPLREWLGDTPAGILHDMFPPEYQLVHSEDFVAEANWKCRMENAVESYHVEMVHSATFGKMPDQENVIHEMEPGWSVYYATETQARSRIEERMDRFIHRLAGQPQDRVYKNYFRYPHLMFTSVRLFRSMEWVIPLSPTRTRMIYKIFCYENPASRKSRIARKMLGVWARKFFAKLVREDAEAIEWMQKGLNSPEHPSEGVVSAREERCNHFQQYIKEMTGGVQPAPQEARVFANSHRESARAQHANPGAPQTAGYTPGNESLNLD